MRNTENYKEAITKSFEVWKESGIDVNNPFELLIIFYKADRSLNEQLIDELSSLNYESNIRFKRSMIFFKGTELLATKTQIWTEESLLNDILKLNQLAEANGFVLENFLARGDEE